MVNPMNLMICRAGLCVRRKSIGATPTLQHWGLLAATTITFKLKGLGIGLLLLLHGCRCTLERVFDKGFQLFEIFIQIFSHVGRPDRSVYRFLFFVVFFYFFQSPLFFPGFYIGGDFLFEAVKILIDDFLRPACLIDGRINFLLIIYTGNLKGFIQSGFVSPVAVLIADFNVIELKGLLTVRRNLKG